MTSQRVRTAGKFAAASAGVAALAMTAAGCDAAGSGIDGGSTLTSSQSYSVSQHLSSVRINDSGGNISVVAGSGPGVVVTEQYEYSDGRPVTAHSVSGSTLTLDSSGCNDSSGKCEVDYSVQVPAGVDVDAGTSGGDITGSGLAAGTLDASTSGGNVNLAFAAVPDNVDASTTGGDVTITVPQGSYAVQAGTDGGQNDVAVPIDNASAHRIKAHSDGGDVTVKTA